MDANNIDSQIEKDWLEYEKDLIERTRKTKFSKFLFGTQLNERDKLFFKLGYHMGIRYTLEEYKKIREGKS